MNTSIIYEFPLNERMRVFIRLEQLFNQFKHHLYGDNEFDKRAAISVLLDIMAIFKRNDLKSEILKELDRQSNALHKIAQNQNEGVNAEKLQELLMQLREISQKLYAMTGKIGGHVLENDLFQSIVQRSSIPGGTCSFDLPNFHYWLAQDKSVCLHDLHEWSSPFTDIWVAIDLILNFIRSSNTTTEEVAEAGFFQGMLESNLAYQLLILEIDKTLPYFIEISGGKHRCTIRFMHPSFENQRPKQCNENVPFILTRCVF